MAQRKKQRRPAQDRHSFLAIRVEGYEVSADAGINLNLKMDRPLFPRADEPAYEYVTTLDIAGVATNPHDRAGEHFEITLRGEGGYRSGMDLTLRDMQARDEGGSLRYRTYRGERLPVYEPPPGLCRLYRKPSENGERIWTVWLYLAPRLVSDMLIMLSQSSRPLFLAIHERKTGRERWVESIALRTTDPATEE